MSRFIDLSGERFNRLIVLCRVENSKNGQTRWKCKCDCGNETIVSSSNLKNNSVKSCGCLRYEPHNTHHLSNTKLYNIWYKMKQRCYCIEDEAYKYYGGRGIGICKEWVNDFVCFYNWAYTNGYKKGLTIERINNEKGYSPTNCKWATAKEQANNRRSCRVYTYNGKTLNLMQWCKELDLPYKTIHSRLYKSGWSFKKAITTPINAQK